MSPGIAAAMANAAPRVGPVCPSLRPDYAVPAPHRVPIATRGVCRAPESAATPPEWASSLAQCCAGIWAAILAVASVIRFSEPALT